jgi:molecular chaperone GrpE (heat shock protein)
MKNWLTNLLAPRRDPTVPDHPLPILNHPGGDAASELLEQQREAQSLRIELQACEETIVNLHQEIERLRSRQDQHLAENLTARLSVLFGELSGPASQILTQEYLVEVEQKPLDVRDVLTVARRIVRALERHGLVVEGKVGDQVAFDPNRHSPISAGLTPQPGQPVTVRFAGMAYAGKIIRKAGVE